MDYKKSFRLGRKGIFLGAALVLTGLLLCALSNAAGFAILCIGGLACLAGGLLIEIYYKCPHCGKSLTHNIAALQNYCPHCGKKLD